MLDIQSDGRLDGPVGYCLCPVEGPLGLAPGSEMGWAAETIVTRSQCWGSRSEPQYYGWGERQTVTRWMEGVGRALKKIKGI